ncbi:MAG: PhzF family phenazine biosynthesis protein [Deltaproteobacteria bacterium]|nr:PhzF family phenazine biosynthesis protein [Deltaproteobacteria bacterium]
MRKFSFKKIDAFASQESDGNQAGAIYLSPDERISAQEMQRIARELKGFVSEVGYVRPVDEKSFDLKYYSSEREVDFCGHATIAIMYDLIAGSQKLIEKPTINISTSKGTLLVENRIQQENAVFISAPQPKFSSVFVTEKQIAEALKIAPAQICADYPLAIVNAGLETLLVPIHSLQAILSISPDLEELKQFCMRNSIDIITVFSDQVADTTNRYRTRVFAPTFGYLEDPATGSGNAAFGYYILQHNLWDGEFISLEQNADHDWPYIIKLKAKHDEKNKPRLMFGGSAIVRISGQYFLT